MFDNCLNYIIFIRLMFKNQDIFVARVCRKWEIQKKKKYSYILRCIVYILLKNIHVGISLLVRYGRYGLKISSCAPKCCWVRGFSSKNRELEHVETIVSTLIIMCVRFKWREKREKKKLLPATI